MKANTIIIAELCARLRDNHGYSFGDMPDLNAIDPVSATRHLKALNIHETDSDFMMFVKRELDVGRFLENDARHAAAVRDIETLTAAGVLPAITVRKDGVLANIVGALTWGRMTPEESRLLSELRAQGTKALVEIVDPDTTRVPDQMIETIREEMQAWVAERGLVITAPVRSDALSEMTDQEIMEILLVTDPHDGLYESQEFVTKMQKAGLQGMIRDQYEIDNRRKDYESLVALGVLPKVERPAPTGSFISRMIGKVGNAMSSVPTNDELPALTEMGREVLRAVLDEKVLSADLGVDRAPV